MAENELINRCDILHQKDEDRSRLMISIDAEKAFDESHDAS